MGVPPNGWFISWKRPRKWMRTEIPPISGNLQINNCGSTLKKKKGLHLHTRSIHTHLQGNMDAQRTNMAI
jgi:hypothetical protein